MIDNTAPERVTMDITSDGRVEQRKVGPMNCSKCGRFVWGEDCGLAWDDYCGGWEADPLCKRCQGDPDA